MSDINPEKPDEMTEKTEEKPMIVASTENNSALQARVNKALKTVSVVLIVLGAVLVAGYIALSTALETLAEEGKLTVPAWAETGEWVMLFLGAILLAVGIVLVVTAKRREKEADKLASTNIFEFYSFCVVVRSIRGGEEIATVRLVYKDIFRSAWTKGILLLYPNSVTVYAVDLSKLSAEEVSLLEKIFPRKK